MIEFWPKDVYFVFSCLLSLPLCSVLLTLFLFIFFSGGPGTVDVSRLGGINERGCDLRHHQPDSAPGAAGYALRAAFRYACVYAATEREADLSKTYSNTVNSIMGFSKYLIENYPSVSEQIRRCTLKRVIWQQHMTSRIFFGLCGSNLCSWSFYLPCYALVALRNPLQSLFYLSHLSLGASSSSESCLKCQVRTPLVHSAVRKNSDINASVWRCR